MELLIDGVRYKLWTPKDEAALEDMVKEHAEDIFGEDSIYFDIKQTLRSQAGIGSKPDGYVIALGDAPQWYIIEVELSAHPLYEHIVPQMTKFSRAINDLNTQRAIVNAMYSEIKNDVVKHALVQKRIGAREIHEFLSDLMSSRPTLVIVIEKKTEVLEEVCTSLPLETKVVEFKTFEKEGTDLAVHAHLFEPLQVRPAIDPTKGFIEELRKRFAKKKPEFKLGKVHNGYCSIPIASHPRIHTEWRFSWRTGLGIELHLERGRHEENSRLLEKIRAHSSELEKSIGEPLTFESPWYRKWARVYTCREPTQLTEEFKEWAVDTMIRFYETFKLLLDKIDTKS